ncbi:MAG TPA: histidine phosphatase family protein [Streptosporangiaceae bacterium]|jgi:probable phosphoglycerate mutase
MTVVHWARHGENVANVSRRFSYRVFDGDLTDRGIAQAGQLAGTLSASGHRYGLLVCSPLRRARQTAQIVSARLRLPVRAELEDLREVNVGDLDGRNDDTAWQTYDAILAGWRCGQLGQRFPGGESGHELAGRIGRALRTVAELAGDDDAVVVAHGASVRAAVPALTGLPDPGADLATGGMARFVVTPGGGTANGITLAAWT